MNRGRRILNITLIIMSCALIVWVVRICRQPSPSHTHSQTSSHSLSSPVTSTTPDYSSTLTEHSDIISAETVQSEDAASPSDSNSDSSTLPDTPRHSDIKTTRLPDTDIHRMTGKHPFSAEARKVLNGGLEESDSLSRRKILSYCEHLRTSYTTRDLDFIRQVFSNNALIIVGNIVRTSATPSMKGSSKVTYSRRSKQEYIDRLAKIFQSGKNIDLKFSGFRIMRHPTMDGIYGVTLRQHYSCGSYSDDGWLFLLWDFRDPSMPRIDVRTWQPAASISADSDEIIDMSDFNLE